MNRLKMLMIYLVIGFVGILSYVDGVEAKNKNASMPQTSIDVLDNRVSELKSAHRSAKKQKARSQKELRKSKAAVRSVLKRVAVLESDIQKLTQKQLALSKDEIKARKKLNRSIQFRQKDRVSAVKLKQSSEMNLKMAIEKDVDATVQLRSITAQLKVAMSELKIQKVRLKEDKLRAKKIANQDRKRQKKGDQETANSIQSSAITSAPRLSVNLPSTLVINQTEVKKGITGRIAHVKTLSVNDIPIYVRPDNKFYIKIDFPKQDKFELSFEAEGHNGNTLIETIQVIRK